MLRRSARSPRFGVARSPSFRTESFPTSLWSLNQVLKATQGLIPEVVELFTERGQAGGIDTIDPASADRFFVAQPCVLQDLEVLRYGWSRHWQLCCEIAH